MSENKYEWGEDAKLDSLRTKHNVSEVCKRMKMGKFKFKKISPTAVKKFRKLL